MICWDAGIHWVVSRLVFIPLAKTRPRNFLLYYHYISKNVYTVKSLKTNENLFVAMNFVVRMFCWCFLFKNIFCSINPFSFVYTDRSIFGETVLGFSFFNSPIIFFFFFKIWGFHVMRTAMSRCGNVFWEGFRSINWKIFSPDADPGSVRYRSQ